MDDLCCFAIYCYLFDKLWFSAYTSAISYSVVNSHSLYPLNVNITSSLKVKCFVTGNNKWVGIIKILLVPKAFIDRISAIALQYIIPHPFNL